MNGAEIARRPLREIPNRDKVFAIPSPEAELPSDVVEVDLAKFAQTHSSPQVTPKKGKQ